MAMSAMTLKLIGLWAVVIKNFASATLYIYVYCIEYLLLAVSIRSAFEFQSGETVDYWSLSTIVARLL